MLICSRVSRRRCRVAGDSSPGRSGQVRTARPATVLLASRPAGALAGWRAGIGR